MAIRIGLDLNYFWDLTPKQFKKHLDVFVERKKEEAREVDAQNYLLGKYMAYAVNDPKSYPEKPFMTEKRQEIMTDEEMERMAIRLNKKFNAIKE